ncbi:TolC family outer membrane protein [Achromobacter xylosoxidans]|uniref:TolC family outer membrane protein n=1 Tax=Alcaligenes xylosoxydans xylosoxydans TaxID=85698 RepID=UPI0004B04F98|nr:TolC family outer membrane protein [Achromobacter xylosoxidans]MCH4592493.1 TolC family outer membrane protein [Achromobacter xylosoxidans]MDH0520094.1 TolC family outer membrane protein [Achromobacter xylosoxidans]MDH0543990.1 TolC family outer membrane protein [Achromobacter xylosoxidans]CUI88715.1 Outer membrane protein tolC precursor [Achromobacter xylosoxidans]CUJ46107.1 Outer membrane protein tolC precursor [Achromobacter xylosoxidans]
MKRWQGRLAAAWMLMVAVFMPGSGAAQALDFQQAYTMALASDPTWQAARARERADAEEAALGRSGLLPNLSYHYSRARNDTTSRQQTRWGALEQRSRYASYASGFTLSQPLFDAAAFAQYRAGRERAEAGGLTLKRARQALAVRLLQAYTAVLYAQQALALTQSQERSLQEDARRSARFVAAGQGTRTDQLEIEARAHVVQAQEIEARDRLRDARNALRAIVGPGLADNLLAPLQESALAALAVEGRDLSAWRQLALASNPELLAQRHLLEASRQRYQATRAGHLPTARLVARKQLTNSNGENQIGQRYDSGSVGIEVSIPLYSGGRTSAASGQALAEAEEAQHKLDAATWALLDDLARQFHTFASSRERITAYRQAAEAAAQRVRATRRSVLGGERTNLDVLDAERQRFEALRDLDRARYDNLLAWLTLRWQAGVLSDDDVARIGALFVAG